MRNRTNRRVLRARKKRSRKLFWLVVALAIVGTLVLRSDHAKEPQTPNAQHVQPLSPEQQNEIGKQFFNRIALTLDPTAPINSYMPEGLKNRLIWLNAQQKMGRLTIGVAPYFMDKNGKPRSDKAFMVSNILPDGNYIIGVAGLRLYEAVQQNSGQFPVITPEWKNFIALALAHEVIHLENKGYFTKQDHTAEERLNEELRAWIITCELTRVIRNAGQDVGYSNALIDDAVRACQYRLPCAGLRSILTAAGVGGP